MKKLIKEYYSTYSGIDITKILHNSHLASADIRKSNRINKLRFIPQSKEPSQKYAFDNISIAPLLDKLEKLQEPAPIEVVMDAILDIINRQAIIVKPIYNMHLVFKYIAPSSPMLLKHRSLEIVSAIVSKSYNEYRALIPQNLAAQLITLLQNETKTTTYEVMFCIIGSITRDDKEFRNHLLSNGISKLFADIALKELDRKSMCALMFAISGILYIEQKDPGLILPLCTIINDCLNYTDPQLINITSLSVNYLCQDQATIATAMNAINIERCMEQLNQVNDDVEVALNFAESFGKIIFFTSSSDFSNRLLKNHFLNILESPMFVKSKKLQCNVCSILSMLVVTVPTIIESLLQESQWSIIKRLTRSDFLETKKEAFFLIATMLDQGSTAEKDMIIKESELLHCLIEEIKSPIPINQSICLKILLLYLKEQPRNATYLIVFNGYLSAIERVYYEKNALLSDIANEILMAIEKYK